MMKNLETVKTVNGYDITRVPGTRFFYYIYVSDRACYQFKTCKAAAEYAETLPKR